jgi:hypothetical protein
MKYCWGRLKTLMKLMAAPAEERDAGDAEEKLKGFVSLGLVWC